MLTVWPSTGTPLLMSPPGSSRRCGCRLSRYRSPEEERRAPCQLAEPDEPATLGRQKTGTVTGRVLVALEPGPITMRDLARQAGLSTSTVKGVLRRLTRSGTVTMRGSYKRPVYELAGHGANLR